MATHDYVLANQSGSSFRTDLNNALAAIVSLNSSSSEPSTTYAFMLWVDTTNNKIKLRNSANNAWITLFTSTGGIEVAQDSSFDGDVTFSGANHNILWDKSADALEFADNAECRFGTGSDLKLFHDGSNSYIKHVGTDDLWIIGETDDVNIKAADNIILQPQNGENGVRIVGNDSVELYYDSTVRFNTNSAGATCHGNLTLTSSTDTVLQVETSGTGSGDDARIELITQESTFTIQNDRSLGSDGALTISPGSDNGIIIKKDGEIEIYHDNSLRFSTASTGCVITGEFRAYTSVSDSDWTSGNRHVLQQGAGATSAFVLEHSHNSEPYGMMIDFSDDAPDNNSQWFMSCDDSSANRFKIWSDGDVDNHDNSYGAISDIKLKENVVDAKSQWDDVKAVKVRNFNFKDKKDKTLLGVVAQEIETISPGLVNECRDQDKYNNDLGTTTKSVKYSILYMKAFKALQEAMAKIETLETKVAALEG